MPRAPITHVLLLLCVLAYVGVGVFGGRWWTADAGDLIRAGGAFAPALAAGEWWRTLTAIFLHGGALHLLLNAIALRDIGAEVEARDGGGRLLLVFLLAGAAGFAASSAWHPEAVGIGASGAILGLIGWWGMDVWQATERTNTGWRAVRLRALAIYLALVFGAGLAVPGIDNVAHLAGLLCGAGMRLGAGVRGRRLAASAVAVAVGVWLGLVAYPDEWARRQSDRVLFEETYRLFVVADRQANASLQDISRASRGGVLADSEALRRLDAEVLAPLAENQRRWQDVRFASSALTEEAAIWATYARVRVEAIQALRVAMVTGDRTQLARFQQLLREAGQLAEGSSADAQPPDAATNAR